MKDIDDAVVRLMGDDETCHGAKAIAEFLGVDEKDVLRVQRALAQSGLAHILPLCSLADETKFAGSGYALTRSGHELYGRLLQHRRHTVAEHEFLGWDL